jgi:FdhE protein
VLQVEGDDALRLDTCEACLGYLKTYAGEGEESLFLLGWTTLHLDVLARERGYENTGASLFEI